MFCQNKQVSMSAFSQSKVQIPHHIYLPSTRPQQQKICEAIKQTYF